jgi:hypothetical protein
MVVLGGALVSACGERRGGDGAGPRDSIALGALVDVPLYPGAAIGDIGGSGETAQATLTIAGPRDSVAAWYRRQLLGRGWTMVNDARAPDGTITLHATRPDGRPLWVMVGQDAPTAPTTVTVVGAVPDSTRS